MTAVEMAAFLLLVITPVLLVVALCWYVQWRRDPERFKTSFRDVTHRSRISSGR